MIDNKKKEFSICQVFNLSNLKDDVITDGDVVKRFGLFSKIQLYKHHDVIYPYLLLGTSKADKWSINAISDVMVNGKPFRTGLQFEFTHNRKTRNLFYIFKNDFLKFGIDESVKIEFHVKINEMTGIPEKQKSMNFDDDATKEASDVVLLVGDQKFYVNKMYLSLHSTYFKSLFSGKFSESQKSEIELKDIDSNEFQHFLEVLYAVSPIENETISEILELSDFFDAKIVVRRCEDFLMNNSKKSLDEKFGVAVKYKMDNLKNTCLSDIQNPNDIREVLQEVSDDHDNCIFKDLLEKSLSFK